MSEPLPDTTDDRLCSIAASLSVIGDRWTLLILRDAFRGVRRFDALARDLGIARNLLADRLQKLVDRGILSKVPYQSKPTRYEYRLTPRGVALSPVLVSIMHWGDKHLAIDGPPVVLTHDICGTPVEQPFVCRTCDTELSPLNLTSRPGPGRRSA